MRTNKPVVTKKTRTYEGAIAIDPKAAEELNRAVLTCLLFENTFYEKGSSIATRIKELVPQVDPSIVAQLADNARNKHGLRHVSLFLARELARHPKRDKIRVANVVDSVVQRADELAEFMSLYWLDGRQPISAQVKKGLAKAFTKFNAFQLAKYNRQDGVKLRDVMFMVNPCPKDKAQAIAWEQLVKGELPVPDTWEVALSAGADKKATWKRLIQEKKLGGLATLRNLRNMEQAGVDKQTIRDAIGQANFKGVLPFQFFAAASHASGFEPELETAMLMAAMEMPKLQGETMFLVDVSGSMGGQLSSKSELTRQDAAAALAVLLRERCANVEMFAFSDDVYAIPPRKGFALRDAINKAPSGGTYLKGALSKIKAQGHKYDRLIVITDEQSHDGTLNAWVKNAYSINVAPYKPGLNYTNGWIHINGWSERVCDYIMAVEDEFNQ